MSKNYWQGENIRLRGLEPEDWEAFYLWNQETETQQNLDRIWFPGSKEMVKEWAFKTSKQRGEGDVYFFVIEERQTGDIVGSINTNSVDQHNGNFAYGLGIIESKRKQGYAQEAIYLLLRYFFEELRYVKVTVGIFSHNEASLRLHEKLGFQLEGRLRSMVYQNGQYWDLIKMGMLKEEFLERKEEVS